MSSTNRTARRHRRRPQSVALAVVALSIAASGVLASAAGATKTPEKSKAPYVVGVITDLTGSSSTQGQAAKTGLAYYQKEVNATGGINGHKLQWQYCDSESTSTGGSQCATQLAGVNTHNVLLLSSLTGTLGAANALPQSDVGVSDVTVLNPKKGTNIYQQDPAESVLVAPLINLAEKDHITKIGIIYTSDAPGAAQSGALEAAAGPSGIHIISEPMSDTATDVTPQLIQLQQQGAQIIFSATITPSTNAVLSSYHTLGMTLPIVLGGQAVTDLFLQSIGFSLPPQMYAITPMGVGPGFTAPVTSAWKAFSAGILKFTKTPVDSESAAAYYVGCLVARVLLRTNNGSASADETFMNTHSVSCLGSTIDFPSSTTNVSTGVPVEVVQAGKTAANGWGPVRQQL
jgi:ABC-type branched-subunit amino acid transport system substrate-binding protein